VICNRGALLDALIVAGNVNAANGTFTDSVTIA
jgi:hypothetical protein